MSSFRLTLPAKNIAPKPSVKSVNSIPTTSSIVLLGFPPLENTKENAAITAETKAKTAYSKSFTKITSVVIKKGQTSEVSLALTKSQNTKIENFECAYKLSNCLSGMQLIVTLSI